jgi:hypothetical protein
MSLSITPANATTATGTGSVTLTLPTHSAGDLLVIIACEISAGNAPTPPTGYTEAWGDKNTNSTVRAHCFYKEANANEPSTVGVTMTNTMSAIMFTVETTTTARVSHSAADEDADSGASVPVSPTLAVSTGGILIWASCTYSNATQDLSGGETEIADSLNGSGPRVVAYYTSSYSNPTGTATWTNSTRWVTGTHEVVEIDTPSFTPGISVY